MFIPSVIEIEQYLLPVARTAIDTCVCALGAALMTSATIKTPAINLSIIVVAIELGRGWRVRRRGKDVLQSRYGGNMQMILPTSRFQRRCYSVSVDVIQHCGGWRHDTMLR